MPRKIPPVVFDFKAARKARGVSQHKAAEILHATQPSISRWESDGSMPEVYKMAWNLYWQLEDLNGNSRKLDVTKHHAKRSQHDTKSNGSAEESKRKRGKAGRRAKTARRGAVSIQPGIQPSSGVVSVDSEGQQTA